MGEIILAIVSGVAGYFIGTFAYKAYLKWKAKKGVPVEGPDGGSGPDYGGHP